MDGLELLDVIRDRWPDSRVVIHSGVVNAQLARQAMAAGAYLSKSAHTTEFLNTIASASRTLCAPPSELTHTQFLL